MSVPGADKAVEGSFGELAQTVSEQAMVLARQEVGRARREMTARARGASTGAAMVGGAALLGTLAAGTGTAALVLLLARRPEPSAAAFGVTGLYAGAGVLLARQGIARLRAAAPATPEETPPKVEKGSGPSKKPARSAQAGTRSAASRTKKAASTGTKKPRVSG